MQRLFNPGFNLGQLAIRQLPILLLALSWMMILSTSVKAQQYKNEVSQAESEFGFSPHLFLYSPENSYLKVYGRASTSLPIQFSNPLSGGIQAKMNAHPVFTRSGSENYSALLTQIDAGMPLYDGNIGFSYSENFANRYLVESSKTSLNIDTTIHGSDILLKSNMSSSYLFEQNWKTLSLAYTLHLERTKYLGFRLHKHLYHATTNGNMKGFWQGNILYKSQDLVTQYPINYDSDRFYTDFSGSVSGSAWSPEFQFRWKRWKWKSLISVNIPLKGQIQFQQSAPYFLDSLSLAFKDPLDSLLTEENLNYAQSGAVTQYNLSTQEIRMNFQTPEIHSLSFEAYPEIITLSLTWFRQKFGLNNESSEGFPEYVEWQFSPDFTLASHIEYDGFYSDLALLSFESSESDAFFSEMELLSLSNFLDYGHIPYWLFGAQFGDEIQLQVEYVALPIHSLSLGVQYEF